MLETKRVILNPFFRLNLKKPITCDLFLTGNTVELPTEHYVPLLAALDRALAIDTAARKAADVLSISVAEGKAVVEDLMAAEILVPEERQFPELPAVHHWIDRGWLEALMLHLRTRNLEFVDDVTDAEAVLDASSADIMREERLPEIWKTYPDATFIELPPPAALPSEKLTEVLVRRRSHQPWRGESITLQQLSTMLHFASLRTVRCRRETEAQVKAKPSVLQLSSSFCALETYIVAHAIRGLEPGVYFYDPQHHRVTRLKSGPFRDAVCKAALGQKRASSGSCTFLITAVWERYMYRYRHSRAFHRLMISVSELTQKYLVLATALQLNTFLTPNLHYGDCDDLLGTNSYKEGTLCLITVG